MAQVVQTINSIPSTTKKTRNEGGREERRKEGRKLCFVSYNFGIKIADISVCPF
jgi:hypothetical protein